MKKKLIGLIGIVLTALVLSSQIAPFEVKATAEIEYTMATDEDFSGTYNGGFQYIGSDEYVEIPHVIKGVDVTSYNYMFGGTSVKGVKSTNKNVTNMKDMFYGSQATELDLSNLDTSNVTDMQQMFSYSQATELDLSSFDTSNVTNMRQMFYNSQATELDVSSFDTSKVTDMRYMFYDSQATKLDLGSFDMSSVTSTSGMFSGANATIGYAKTEQDADILNGTGSKPARLLFVVKPITQSNEVDVTIEPGEFSLTAPEISDGFGSVVLEADVQTLHASFGAPFTVKDLRGIQEGWRLDVQADPLANGEHTLPASSLVIKPVTNIERVGSGSGALPTPSQTTAMPIDAGSAVGLVSAPTGGGMGVFDITLPADALAVTIDATTARTDNGGVYKTTLNWSLVQAP